MNATVHVFPTGADALDLARIVMRNSRCHNPIDVHTALDVLAASNDPADIQTVRLHRHRAWAIDGGEFPQIELDWPINGPSSRRLRIMGAVVLFLALIAGAVLLERHWTEANAAAIERIV